jgi:hypothetical protein
VPRDLTGSMSTAIAAKRLRPVFFMEAQFTSGYLRLWSGMGDITWNAQSWTGSGPSETAETVIVGMSGIQESVEVAANGIRLQASGIQSTMVSRILDDCRQNYPVTVWLGLLDLDTDALIADPTQAFHGRMDVPTISDSGNTCDVSLTVENALIDLQRPRERRYTHEDQQIDHPGDMGFEYVSQLQEVNLAWGKTTAQIPSSGGGAVGGPIPRPRVQPV